MSINQLNQTIQAIRDILGERRSADPDVAKDFSELFRSTNRRLAQVSVLIAQNEKMQAHSLSEQTPALPDLIRAFGFEKSTEWANLCKKLGLPHPGFFDSRQVMLVMESYGDGSKSKTSLTDEFRGKMLKGDRAGAVTTLRVALRKNPKDSWAEAELAKILSVEMQSRMLQMQKLLQQGDVIALNRAYEEYELFGFPAEESQLFNQIESECTKFRKSELEKELQNAPTKIEGWKKVGDWGSALEYSDGIRGRARELGVKIGVRGNLLSLMEWADSCRAEENRKNDVKNTESELKTLISDYESSISYREKKSLIQIRNQLGTLEHYRRRGEELKHDWSDELEVRRKKIELYLKGQENTHLHKIRLLVGTIVITTISVLSAGGWLAYDKAKKENETKRVVQAIEFAKKQKTVTELEKLLQSFQANDKNTGFIQQEHKAKIQAEIERIKAVATDIENTIEEFRLRLEVPKREWDEESRQIRQLDQRINDCVIEYRAHLSDLKAKTEKQWLKMAGEKKQSDSIILNRSVSECKREYEDIKPADSTAVLRLKPLSEKLYSLIKENEALPAVVSPGKENIDNLKDLADKISKKLKIAEEIESIKTELAQAAIEHSEKRFYQAIDRLALVPEISTDALKAVKAVAKISEIAGKIRAKIWIPFNDSFILETSDEIKPLYETTTPKEKELCRDLLERAFLDNICVYHLPDETVGTLKMSTVYSIGKIRDKYQDSKGRWFAKTCRIYNADLKDFDLKKNVNLSTDKFEPIATDEPVSRLFRESGMKLFLEALADGSAKAPKISVGRIMDHIAKATDVPESGKVFLLQHLAEICAIRPQAYGVSYLPWYAIYLEKLKGITVIDAEWLQSNSPSSVSWNISFLPKNTEAQLIFYKTLVSTGMTSELSLVGYVPENGLFPDITEVQGGYVIPFENGKIEIFDKKREGLAPYTPIYQLKIQPSEIISKAMEKSSISAEETKQIITKHFPLLEKSIK